MYNIKEAIMERDGINSEKADELIKEAKDELNERLADGRDAYDICQEYFGLEPDYIMDLIEQ